MEMSYIVTHRAASIEYAGLDTTARDTVWKNIDDWNTYSPKLQIDINSEDLLFKGAFLNVVEYTKWLKESCGEAVVRLIVISKHSPEIANLIFLGYDCLYMMDEYEQSIMFSTIYNELMRKTDHEFKEYIEILNTYKLFNEYQIAKEYIELREQRIGEDMGNFETAYLDLQLDIIPVFEVLI